MPDDSLPDPHRILLPVIIAVPAAIAAYVLWPDCFVYCHAINVHEVAATPGQPKMATAKFKLVQVDTFHGGIDSDGFGGACVAFKDPAVRQCKDENNCRLPPGLPEGAHTICSSDKLCWINLTPDQCWISVLQDPKQPLKLNEPREIQIDLDFVRDKLFPETRYPERYERPPNVSAKLISCLNGKFDDLPPCRGGPGKYRTYESVPGTLALPSRPYP